MERPVVGITCDTHKEPGSSPFVFDLLLDRRYGAMIRRAGGLPILLPIVRDVEVIRHYATMIDGLVISGGDDLHPRSYGEKPMPGADLRVMLRDRERFERRLYDAVRARRLPVLGICFGMQFLNVAHGGSLYQDIAKQVRRAQRHEPRKEAERCVHRVRVKEGSVLHEIFGRRTVRVASVHHQAVRDLAPRLHPIAWAGDGIVEAFEDGDRLLGVQWHPERTPRSPAQRALFRWFVRRCKAPRRRRRR